MTDFTGSGDGAHAVALQPDGKIVLAGESAPHDAGATAFALARYNPDGSLDSTFSGDGRQTTSFGTYARARDVLVQPDGKILAAGEGSPGFTLARYNQDGSLDMSFSDDGIHVTDFGIGSFGVGHALALQPDGKIILAGYSSQQTVESGETNFTVVRYQADGTLDSTFSEDGIVVTDFNGGFDFAFDVELQADGKMVMSGSAGHPSTLGEDFALLRYNPDGSLDPTFSSDGKQTTDFVADGDAASEVEVLPSGKILAAGAAGSGNASFALAQYTSNGSLDPTFSGDGKQTNGFSGFFANGEAMAVQANGQIVVGGYYDGLTSIQIDFGLARYNPDGSLDHAFGASGFQTTDFASEDDSAYALAIQSDGKLIAAGWAEQFSSDDFAVARYEDGGPGAIDPPPLPDGGDTQPQPTPPVPQPKPTPKPKTAKLTNVRLSSKTIKAGKRATLSFRLSAAARVRVKILKLKGGVRQGKRCMKPSKTTSGKRCALQVVAFKRSLGAGAHRITLPKLKTGRHRVVLSGVTPPMSRLLLVGV